MRTYVVVRLQVDGMHNFPAAREIFPEVGFLADRHRHIFHVEAKKEVFHDDRDVEFIMFKRDIQDYLKQMYYKPETRTHEFGPKSCEMLAKEILNQFDCVSVSVWEDLENGAIVEA
jgi:hypothetical protein